MKRNCTSIILVKILPLRKSSNIIPCENTHTQYCGHYYFCYYNKLKHPSFYNWPKGYNLPVRIIAVPAN